MWLEPSLVRSDVYSVRVDTNEVDCGRKRLPYPTWIGTVDFAKRKINVWTPAAYTPRGYHAAARAMLETALALGLALRGES